MTSDEIAYERSVFDALLFFASDKGNRPLPNDTEAITFITATAVVEYLGGDGNRIFSLLNQPFGNGTTVLTQSLHGSFQQTEKRINPALAKALKKLIAPAWKTCRGESYWKNRIGDWLQSLQRGYQYTFFLTAPFVNSAKEEVEKRLDSDTVSHCREIGTLMKGYVDRYLKQFVEVFLN